MTKHCDPQLLFGSVVLRNNQATPDADKPRPCRISFLAPCLVSKPRWHDRRISGREPTLLQHHPGMYSLKSVLSKINVSRTIYKYVTMFLCPICEKPIVTGRFDISKTSVLLGMQYKLTSSCQRWLSNDMCRTAAAARTGPGPDLVHVPPAMWQRLSVPSKLLVGDARRRGLDVFMRGGEERALLPVVLTRISPERHWLLQRALENSPTY